MGFYISEEPHFPAATRGHHGSIPHKVFNNATKKRTIVNWPEEGSFRQVLDAMGAAAELMSMPPRLLEGAAQDPARDPRVKPHQRLAAAAAKSVSAVQSQARVPEVRRKTEQETEAGDGGGDGAKQGALAQGKTRVWGVRSLARQGAAPKRTHRNRCEAFELR